ncbi:MAG TPA: shikimate kinase [Pyrinomonadaceae bacterium]|nr:shikimate kinase [Pyrinomonadaceae bacterium]
MDNETRIVLTGFMGVGKSTVARHLASILQAQKIDLDSVIEAGEKRTIAEIIKTGGIMRFRQIETETLRKILAENDARILALGGGAWTIAENRRLIKTQNCTSVWLESSFEHCWRNIKSSKRERPLAKNKDQARKLFDERQNYYCLTDWHFIVKPDLTSYEIAKKIAEEVFLIKLD